LVIFFFVMVASRLCFQAKQSCLQVNKWKSPAPFVLILHPKCARKEVVRLLKRRVFFCALNVTLRTGAVKDNLAHAVCIQSRGVEVSLRVPRRTGRINLRWDGRPTRCHSRVRGNLVGPASVPVAPKPAGTPAVPPDWSPGYRMTGNTAFRATADCFAALATTIPNREAQWLLWGYSSTGRQNDVISLNNARASAFTNNVLIIFFVSLIVPGPPQLFLFP